jgi:hypothetical protein
MHSADLKELKRLIEEIETAATGLMKNAQGVQAIERNADRILASTKMLKINVCDLLME